MKKGRPGLRPRVNQTSASGFTHALKRIQAGENEFNSSTTTTATTTTNDKDAREKHLIDTSNAEDNDVSAPYRCGPCTASVTRLVVAGFVVAMSIAIIVLVILTYIRSGNVAESNWCGTLSGQEALTLEGMDANATHRAVARVGMHGNELTIWWYILKQTGDIGLINTVAIHGPLNSTHPIVSDQVTYLCGPPTLLVCEGVDPSVIEGDRGQLDPGSISPEPFIRDVRCNPELYYLRAEGPNGALRMPLGSGCDAGT